MATHGEGVTHHPAEQSQEEAFYRAVEEQFTNEILHYLPDVGVFPHALIYATEIHRNLLRRGRAALVADASKNGYQSLLAEEYGGKRESAFATSPQVFSDGTGNPCLVVGFHSPSTGIGASHRFTYTLERFVPVFARKVHDRRFIEELREEAKEKTPYHLFEFATTTAGRAIHAFLQQSEGVIPQDITAFIHGVTFLKDQPELDIIRTAIHTTAVANGLSLPEETPFAIDELGNQGQVVYGGRNHEDFSKPTYIPTSVF